MPIHVGINGFGRVGKCTLLQLLTQQVCAPSGGLESGAETRLSLVAMLRLQFYHCSIRALG